MENYEKLMASQQRIEKIVATQSRSIALMTARIGLIHDAIRDLVAAMNENTRQMAELCAATTGYMPNIENSFDEPGDVDESASQEIPEQKTHENSHAQAGNCNQSQQAQPPLRPQEGDIRLDGKLPG